MPVYEYRCTECDYVFDMVRFVIDDETPKCPECGAETMKVPARFNFKMR